MVSTPLQICSSINHPKYVGQLWKIERTFKKHMSKQSPLSITDLPWFIYQISPPCHLGDLKPNWYDITNVTINRYHIPSCPAEISGSLGATASSQQWVGPPCAQIDGSIAISWRYLWGHQFHPCDFWVPWCTPKVTVVVSRSKEPGCEGLDSARRYQLMGWFMKIRVPPNHRWLTIYTYI